mmetsp:Transcript_4858/g.31055  ORF Transcript_4858/g.31055 Transcript_4858/m.31055 type:complete len:114 (+) Transcript_4858:2106-2447(+)
MEIEKPSRKMHVDVHECATLRNLRSDWCWKWRNPERVRLVQERQARMRRRDASHAWKQMQDVGGADETVQDEQVEGPTCASRACTCRCVSCSVRGATDAPASTTDGAQDVVVS